MDENLLSMLALSMHGLKFEKNCASFDAECAKLYEIFMDENY